MYYVKALSGFGSYGTLTTSRCLIDKHFTLKISKLGFNELRAQFKNHRSAFKERNSVFWTEKTLDNDIFDIGRIIERIVDCADQRVTDESGPRESGRYKSVGLAGLEKRIKNLLIIDNRSEQKFSSKTRLPALSGIFVRF